jgi:hypothetical protein
MHLRDAKVDLDGGMVVDGALSLPPEAGAGFPVIAHDALRLENNDALTTIRVVHAHREASGFMRCDPVGVAISPPRGLCDTLRSALTFSSAATGHFTFGSELGFMLAPGLNGAHRRLTDWTLDLEPTADGMNVRAGASLYPPEPGAGRLTLAFKVDDATRAAAAGYHQDAFYDDGAPFTPQATSLEALDLASAPVGSSLELAARENGRWAAIYSREDTRASVPHLTLAISFGDYRRAASGLAVTKDQGAVGRIWLENVNLKLISAMLGGKATASLALRSERLGYIQLHHRASEDYRPVPDTRITEADLVATLDQAGLRLDYRLWVNDLNHHSAPPYAAGELKGALTFSWELLILRFPYFVGNLRLQEQARAWAEQARTPRPTAVPVTGATASSPA